MRRCALALLLIALAPAGARADEAAQARFHYELASRHYAARRYEDAVQHFFHAQRLSPSSRTIYNIALCFSGMSRREQAYQFFTEYLALTDEGAGAAERRAFAEERLEALAPHVARIAVTSEPAGARVYVDEREHGAYGVTPTVLALAPGAHRVWVELEGHREASAEVELARGRLDEITLRPPLVAGTLRVASTPEGSAAVLDASGARRAEGPTPLTAELPPGRYEVVLEADGRHAVRRFVTIADGESAAVEAELPVRSGAVTVTANVVQARVELDGRPIGFTPLVLSDLVAGAHAITVSAPGRQPWAGPLEVSALHPGWLTVTLAPEPHGRSPATWVVGGVGLALLAGAAVTGGVALDRGGALSAQRDSLESPDLRGLRAEVVDLNLATDLLGVGAAISIGVALLLYLLTGDDPSATSEGTLSRTSEESP